VHWSVKEVQMNNRRVYKNHYDAGKVALKLKEEMLCETCQLKCQRFGRNRNGRPRFRCPQCKKTYSEVN
jgi:transposase-like protein